MSTDKTGTIDRPVNAAEFLWQLLSELGAQVGAVWVSGDGQLVPVLTIGLEDCQLFDSLEAKQFLQQILIDTLQQARAQTFDSEGLIEPGDAGHSTLFVAPIMIPGSRPGVILIVERPNLPQQQRLGIMRHIEVRCREISRQDSITAEPEMVSEELTVPEENPVESLETPHADVVITSEDPVVVRPATGPEITFSPQARVEKTKTTGSEAEVLEYVLALSRSLDLSEVANVVVNDGRVLFEVDRVSLATVRGQRVTIKAVSGQESVHPRGNLIRSMRRLTQLAITAGEPFRFDGSLNTIPKQLEEPLAEFIQEAGTRFLLIVPLIEPERLVKPEEPGGGKKVKHAVRGTIGALIIEQMNSSEPSKRLKSVLDLVTDHIAAATFNARNHSTIFLLPVWRSIGRFMEWLRGSRLAIAMAIVLAIALFTASMIVVPWEYRVEGMGRLMPVVQREVFAPWDGQVTDLFVEGDERVEQGQELIKLRNDELEAEFVKKRTELDEKSKFLSSLKAQYEVAEQSGKSDERVRVKGKEVETQVEVKGLQAQIETLKDRRERLTVRAPIAGKVTTFQVRQLLLNRPVKRGDVLVQVMDDKGDWQLELEIAEHRVGRILKAQNKLGADLPIEYRLLTSPENSYQATLKSMGTRTVTSEESGSVIEARASLDTDKLPKTTIGADVRARIGCGQSNLGDVLFGDIVEFIQRYLWW